MRHAKTLLPAILSTFLALSAAAQEPDPAASDTTLQRLNKLEKTTSDLENRLGRQSQSPTPLNSVERRLQNLEKKLSALERDLDQLDTRLKRLEAKR